MKKFAALSLVFMLFCSLSTSAFSWDHWGHYGYHGGHYYRHAGWWGFGGLVTGLAVGAYVASLPPEHETIVVDGVPYYYYDGYYYQSGPNGYVVVNPPAGAADQSSDPAGSGPMNSPMMYILGTLAAILLIACIGVLAKKLLTNERKTV
jgi:hypothetical protein